MELKICHLYPDVLNLYGDRGNILCLKKRLEWRGINCSVDSVGIGEINALTSFDLFFIGGGQDFDQEILLEALRLRKGRQIRSALEDGKTFLCICGGYQMMGHYYKTQEGHVCKFLGAIDFYTVGGKKRMIGNYAYRLRDDSGEDTIVGFENHGGRTYIGSNTPAGHSAEGLRKQWRGQNGRSEVQKRILYLQPRACPAQKSCICRSYSENSPDEEIRKLQPGAPAGRLREPGP